ncbi:MAG TPA: helix-turn-helix transcriptional regulator [Oligoflexia bacterium]|nr:helix-turn-helix transcriptional regulator [Oligoflexia bacterium]
MKRQKKKKDPPRDDYYNLGARVRFIRESRELSQKSLAKTAGISQSTVAQIETGRMDPSVNTLQKIAVALDTDIATIFASKDIHVFDLARLKSKYGDVEKLTPHLYTALGKIIQYAKDIGFLK